jgi:hypothetical protein
VAQSSLVPSRAVELADRVSLNLEAPNQARLPDLTQLRALGVTTGWAAPYVLLDGRQSVVQLRKKPIYWQ